MWIGQTFKNRYDCEELVEYEGITLMKERSEKRNRQPHNGDELAGGSALWALTVGTRHNQTSNMILSYLNSCWP